MALVTTKSLDKEIVVKQLCISMAMSSKKKPLAKTFLFSSIHRDCLFSNFILLFDIETFKTIQIKFIFPLIFRFIFYQNAPNKTSRIMHNGRSHTTNQNGTVAKTNPADKSKVNISYIIFE